jgi:hypothetical protein
MQRDAWIVALVIASLLPVGCGEQVGGYLPATAIARKGFLIDQRTAANLEGRETKLWGFVDHCNMYGDAGAKEILQEWWSGHGPDARSWRFNLKGDASDAVGDSFPVYVPNDAGRDGLLRRFVSNARAEKPTKVFVTGKMFTFHAPTQILDLTGLYLQLHSSKTISISPRVGEQKPGQFRHEAEHGPAKCREKPTHPPTSVIGPGFA